MPGDTTGFDLNALAAGTRSDGKPTVQAAAARTEIPPERVGRFRVERLLGRGGMGSVFLARDVQLDRLVALKIPRLTDAADSNLIQRFFREARSAATLSHPNICPVFDVGHEGDIHFIAMGYIEGRPLTSYVAAAKRQPERQIALVIRKVALALDCAHEKGIVHRDLKPANVMIDARGEPIVMDFGLAYQIDDASRSRLTQDGAILGTPAYMSPEQIDGRAPVGPPSDVYSLGVMLYELLTGQCPFSGSVVSVIGQVLHTQPKAIGDLRPDVSPALSEICSRAMAKNPADRFTSMKDFARALATFLRGEAAAAPTVRMANDDAPREVDPLDSILSELPAAASLSAAPLPRVGGGASLPKWVWLAGGFAVGTIVVLAALVLLRGGDAKTLAQADAANGAIAPGAAVAAERPTLEDTRADSPPSPIDSADATSLSAPAATSSAAPPPQPTSALAAGGELAATPPQSTNTPNVGSSPPSSPAGAASSSPTAPNAAPLDAAPTVSDVTASPPVDGQPAPGEGPPFAPGEGPGHMNGPPFGPPGQGMQGPPFGPPGMGPPFGPGQPPQMPAIRSLAALAAYFKKSDRNRDDQLDPTELMLHVIHRADANQDEMVTLKELQDAYKKLGQRVFAEPDDPNGQYGPKQLPPRRPGKK